MKKAYTSHLAKELENLLAEARREDLGDIAGLFVEVTDRLRVQKNALGKEYGRQSKELHLTRLELAEARRALRRESVPDSPADFGETVDHQHRGDGRDPNEGAAEGPIFVGEHHHSIDGAEEERHVHGRDGWVLEVGP